MRYAVEYIHTSKLRTGADTDDLPWVRMVTRYDDELAAEDQLAWLALDDDGFAYRVVAVDEVAA
jgi:hypothetical protein